MYFPAGHVNSCELSRYHVKEITYDHILVVSCGDVKVIHVGFLWGTIPTRVQSGTSLFDTVSLGHLL